MTEKNKIDEFEKIVEELSKIIAYFYFKNPPLQKKPKKKDKSKDKDQSKKKRRRSC